MSSTRTLGKKSTPHRDPDDPPRRRANKQPGHGTYDNDRPPIIHIISRETGEERCWVVGHSDKASYQGILAEAVQRRGRLFTPTSIAVTTGSSKTTRRSITDSTNGHVMTMAMAYAKCIAIVVKERELGSERSCDYFAAYIKPIFTYTSRPTKRWSMPSRFRQASSVGCVGHQNSRRTLIGHEPCSLSLRVFVAGVPRKFCDQLHAAFLVSHAR